MSRYALDSYETPLAATIAGEDLRPGDDVTLLNEVHEFPSFFWDCTAGTLSPHQTVHVQCAARDGGVPLRVKAICLPFVLLKSPTKDHRIIDTRRVQLVRLDRSYAKRARKHLRRGKPPRCRE
jgi:hypothetical protein